LLFGGRVAIAIAIAVVGVWSLDGPGVCVAGVVWLGGNGCGLGEADWLVHAKKRRSEGREGLTPRVVEC
jgi:hypothetical protein